MQFLSWSKILWFLLDRAQSHLMSTRVWCKSIVSDLTIFCFGYKIVQVLLVYSIVANTEMLPMIQKMSKPLPFTKQSSSRIASGFLGFFYWIPHLNLIYLLDLTKSNLERMDKSENIPIKEPFEDSKSPTIAPEEQSR